MESIWRFQSLPRTYSATVIGIVLAPIATFFMVREETDMGTDRDECCVDASKGIL